MVEIFQMVSTLLLREIRFLGSRTRCWASSSSSSVQKLVIFLHGSGITAFGMEKWLRSLAAEPPPGTGILLPSAPMQRYHLDGQLRSIWHQRRDIDIGSTFEDLDGIQTMCKELNEMVSRIQELGITDITIGGFSMGGHLALHSVYRGQLDVSKCFAISSFLINESELYKLKHFPLVPLFLAHGDQDNIVPPSWAQTCHKKFQNKNVNSSLVIYKGLGHEVRRDVMEDVYKWTSEGSFFL